jgi:hypothetical protein
VEEINNHKINHINLHAGTLRELAFAIITEATPIFMYIITVG